jgi:hypothetical protein
MHSPSTVALVLAFREEGLGARRIAKRSKLPVATVQDWLAGRLPSHSRDRDLASIAGASICERCGHPAHRFAELAPAYVYLLGLYLGDGCISEHPRDVYRLRMFLDLRYPLIIDECEAAIRSVVPRSKVARATQTSNYTRRPEASVVVVSAFSKTWPCLLPQHGPGLKHRRTIRLTNWQRVLVRKYPARLLRGLIHSDGCRFINSGRNWTCPRYSFSNRSGDIMRIFCDACDILELHYTFAPRTVYVSRKADVMRLDEFVGPKR